MWNSYILREQQEKEQQGGFPINRYCPITLHALIVIQDKGVCDLQPLNHPVNCLIIKCFYCAKAL